MIEDANSWLNKKKIDEVLDWQGIAICSSVLSYQFWFINVTSKRMI